MTRPGLERRPLPPGSSALTIKGPVGHPVYLSPWVKALFYCLVPLSRRRNSLRELSDFIQSLIPYSESAPLPIPSLTTPLPFKEHESTYITDDNVTISASSSGVSRNEREARATGDEREARRTTGRKKKRGERPLIFQQRDVCLRGSYHG